MDGLPHNGETPSPDRFGGQTGNGAEVSQTDAGGVHAEYRGRRMSTQRAIALICRADALKYNPGQWPGDVYRVAQCLWCRVADVHVVMSVEFKHAHYKGLQTCGSVWVCPMCAAKVEERRRIEVAGIFAWAGPEGLDSSLHTNTFSHGMGDDLRDLFRKQQHALHLFRANRVYVAEMKAIGYVAMIRALEITYGRNGWHPHTHELKFHREQLNESDAQTLRARLATAWMAACTRAGLFVPGTDDEAAFYHRSIDIRPHFGSGEYLAKTDDKKNWTAPHELAKASSKQGRFAGVHPFQLAIRGNPGDPELFIDYVKATKGKRKLLFSPGLKKLAGIVEKSDEQIAAEDEDKATVIANLSWVWDFIKKTDSKHNTRARVLDAAEQNGKDGIAELLHKLGFDPLEVSP